MKIKREILLLLLAFTFQFLVRLYISLYFTVSIVNQEFTFQFLVRL
ncbi:hypothetical protein HMPREF3037_03264, partial [Candidatus Stoquefichus sp. KLE1796]